MKLKGRMSVEDVSQVKDLFSKGFNQRQIAKQKKISPAHVSNIVHGLVHESVPWPNGRSGSYEEAYGENSQPAVSPIQEDAINRSLKSRTEHHIHSGNQNMEPSEESQTPLEHAIKSQRRIEAFTKILEQQEEIKDLERRREDAALFHENSAEEISGNEQETESTVKSSIWDAHSLSWEDCLKVGKDSPCVKLVLDGDEALENYDLEIYKRAVGITFKALPKEMYSSTACTQGVLEAYDQLINSTQLPIENHQLEKKS